jgi:hypothetical protein
MAHRMEWCDTDTAVSRTVQGHAAAGHGRCMPSHGASQPATLGRRWSTHVLGDKEGLCERRVFAHVSAAAGDQNVHHTTERRCEAPGCTRLY